MNIKYKQVVMDYKKKYKEAVCKIQELLTKGEKDGEVICAYKADFESIFPELKESEDGKIRKGLIRFIKGSMPDNDFRKKYLAWLEKQGEQKSIWHNEDEEPQKDSLILLIMQSGTPIVAKIIEPNHIFNHGERWAYIDDLLERQGEQKPADWSEEDRECMKSLLDILNGTRALTPSEIECHKDWLKSLKDRVQHQSHWKPSATDIIVLEGVIDRGINPINYHVTLHGILEQLKKLREE